MPQVTLMYLLCKRQWRSQTPVKQYWWVVTLTCLFSWFIWLLETSTTSTSDPNQRKEEPSGALELVRWGTNSGRTTVGISFSFTPSWVWYYIQAIWNRESIWIETCQREWDFPWTSRSVQMCELVERPGHCRWWEGHDHRTEMEAEWPPRYHEVSALPRAGYHPKEGHPP